MATGASGGSATTGYFDLGVRTVALAFLILTASAGKVSAQISELGTAVDYAGLELSSSNIFTISSGNTSITGNVGLAANGTLNFSGGGVVTGAVDAGTGATVTITGGSVADGGTVEPYAQMSQDITDAQNAATYYAGLTATQTFSSITSAQTITGSGGVDVIQVNGDIDIQGGGNLTLSGNSSDQFVIDVNDTGVAGNPPDLTLGGGSSIVLNGINASQVVFNLIGTGLEVTTNGNSDTNGIFLAANGGITISGGVHDSEFIAGGALTFQSGPNITQAATFAPVPELDSKLMAAAALAAILGFAGLSRLPRTRWARTTS